MTAIVGVLCRDGVVIGADSSATFGSESFRTMEQPFEKLEIVADRVIIAGTGAIGLGQRFSAVVQQAWTDKVFTNDAITVGKALARGCLDDFISTHVRPRQFGAIVAFSCQKQPQLCEFDIDSLQPELKTDKLWYCSAGSAQPITDPFLALMRRVFWEEGRPTVQDGVFAVTWALEHAIAVNPGGVNAPARVATLERNGNDYRARFLEDAELDEHRQGIEEAMGRLREFRTTLQSPESTPDVPSVD